MMTFFTAQVRKIGAKSVHLINVSYGHTRVHWHKKTQKQMAEGTHRNNCRNT
jgi:hypothetical protein